MLPPLNRTDPALRRVVIMGCGRIGSAIAATLAEEGTPLHILDLDPATFNLLPPSMVDEGHIVATVGDGTLESDLRKAATQDADVFIAVSGSDSRNALAAQIARHILRVPVVICRINEPARKEMYGELGIMAISATNLVTEMILEAVRS